MTEIKNSPSFAPRPTSNASDSKAAGEADANLSIKGTDGAGHVTHADSFEMTVRGAGRLSAAGKTESSAFFPVMDPSSEDFALAVDEKYSEATREIWEAVAQVLVVIQLIQFMQALFEQLLGGGEQPAPPPDDSTTPTAVGRYQPKSVSNSELFDADGPSADDIEQGQLGTCYFLSTLAGVASENPQLVRDNIRQHIDPVTQQPVPGLYDVRFYKEGASGQIEEEWVTVNDQILRDDANRELYAQSLDQDQDGREELWVALYEKAYAVFRAQNGNVDAGYDEIGQGGYGDEAYLAITGRRAQLSNPASMQDEALLNILSRTNPNPPNNGTVMLGSNGMSDSQLAAEGIPAAHMYTVLGTYQDATTGEWRVTVRNPWGVYEPGLAPDGQGGYTVTDPSKFDGTNDGIFSISLNELKEHFNLVVYDSNPTAALANGAQQQRFVRA